MQLLTKASYSDAVTPLEEENLHIAYLAACEGMVLLQNDGTLPLQNKTVALYGTGGSMTIKGGTGSGEVNERHSVSILEGLEARGFTVTTSAWQQALEKAYNDGLAAFTKQQQRALFTSGARSVMELMTAGYQAPEEDLIEPDTSTDTCIYVVRRQAGEGSDRRLKPGDYQFTERELANIRICAQQYKNFVLVINCGSGMDLSSLDDISGIGAILYLCQLGTQGGLAFADVVSGAVTPSGKLADTWAKQYTDIPFGDAYSYCNGDLDNEYYKEGIYVGYRYFDTFSVEPRYPFGYGLSYTDFSITFDKVSLDKTKAMVQTTVCNNGTTYSGKEVVQLYASAPATALDKEYQRLVAFAKTDILAPGATQTVTLTFPLSALSSYREADACTILEAGNYLLRLGNHSRNTVPVALLSLAQEVILSQHENLFALQQPLEVLHAPARGAETIPSTISCLAIDPACFETVTYTYETPAECDDPRVQKMLQSFTIDEMIDLVVGVGMFGGKTRFTLPGAVGNTTSQFWDRGLANATLCDGPAGLRIQKRSTVTKKGKVKAVDLVMSLLEVLPNFIQSMMRGDPTKDPVIYQFTTAFPVATALAQTWNTNLLYQVGSAVNAEMERYGCTYWLAPAVNIHRNPLCGRNFEYFSEDPLLAGTMATAITQGVQQKPGYYVTVKHFACNNQEDNRVLVSSNVTERAMREIYLRAFELPVCEGHAKGIMTSYNKVNGTYSPNNHDLCTKVLRNEWGFDGVVMTDWFSTTKGRADSALAMSAGNDLIMPGGKSYKKEIRNGLKNGTIQEADVRRCCANIIHAILDSAIQKEYIG